MKFLGYIFAILFLTCDILVFSQGGITNNGATLTIASGGKLYVRKIGTGGNIVLAGNGQIELDGDISLEGDWDNNNATNRGLKNVDADGWVKFKGSAAQNITSTATESIQFESFEIDNSLTGTAAVVLGDSVYVGDTLALTAGCISTGSYVLYMTNPIPTRLTPAAPTPSSFVYGVFPGGFRRAIATNTGTYEFPVGKALNTAADFMRFAMINNNLTGVNYLTASVRSLTKSGNQADNMLSNSTAVEDGTVIKRIRGDASGKALLWDLSPNQQPSGGTYGVKTWISNFESGPGDNAFTVLKRPTGSSNFSDFNTYYSQTDKPAPGQPGRTWGGGYAQKTGFTSFSEFGVGDGDTPLPIELLSFNAVRNNDIVDLKWVTSTEINNDYFTVEKTQDLDLFETVVIQEGAGNSNVRKVYKDIDEYPYSGVSYYRLKQTDFDGTSSYSDLVAVSFEEGTLGEGPLFQVFPTPSNGRNVQIRSINPYAANEEVLVTVKNVHGQEVFSKIVVADHQGVFLSGIDPGHRLAAGIYMITGSTENSLQSQLIVIE